MGEEELLGRGARAAWFAVRRYANYLGVGVGVGAVQGFPCMCMSMSVCLCITHAGKRSTP